MSLSGTITDSHTLQSMFFFPPFLALTDALLYLSCCLCLHRLLSLARPTMSGLKLKREDRPQREVFWLTALTWVFMVRILALILTLAVLCALHSAL